MKRMNEVQRVAMLAGAGLLTACLMLTGCQKKSAAPVATSAITGPTFVKGTASGDIIKASGAAGKVGNWGLGNEYEILALLSKYGQDTKYLSQAFDMDGFDDGSVWLASAMTYNELGLVVNSYEGGYKYGDSVGTIDMNDEGVAMLEDNLFCSSDFAKANPNTVKAFLAAAMKGWEYACANPEEAAGIVYKYGSSVSSDHQLYMAKEVKKLVKTDTKGNVVTNYGNMDVAAMQQTLDTAKKYVKLSDGESATKLANFTLADIMDEIGRASCRERV